MRISDWSSDVCSSDLQNIDVNRNFTDYGVAYAQDEVYPILFRALCPDDWTEETIDWSAARDQVTRDYGMKRMVTAAGGGQIVEPTGMNRTDERREGKEGVRKCGCGGAPDH